MSLRMPKMGAIPKWFRLHFNCPCSVPLLVPSQFRMENGAERKYEG